MADTTRFALNLALCEHECVHSFVFVSMGGEGKDTGTKDTISRFGRRNQMSSSNILSIQGLKKKYQFQVSNRDIQW
jgi:hypothetical protein